MPDNSGDRLRSYVNTVFLCDALSALERNMSAIRHLDEEWPAAPAEFKTNEHRAKMKRLYKLFQPSRKGLFRSAASFQTKVTKIWNRHHGELTQMLILPVAALDDMTTEGVMGLAVDYAVQCGILRETKDEKEPYELEEGWDKRYVYMVGDCTTVTNFRGFLNKMRETPLPCTSAHRQSRILRKAFSRFVTDPGQWHIGYNTQEMQLDVYFKVMIKHFQASVGWKKSGQTQQSASRPPTPLQK
mmetsp:Transcript_34293/g.63401  ORF Transcript_34293/g.63401 Transcript_34293/m.63401 type:complete len:243 (+) Transcript_34293:970-1698(+)